MPLTRRATLSALSALLAAASIRTAAGQTSAASLQAEIDRLCGNAIQAKHAAGIAVQIQHGDETLVSSGYGFANLETDTQVTPLSVFRIGSVTKQFTAASILLLREDGRLSLEDPLSKFLPDFPRANEVKIRELLNHTSGIQNISRGIIPSVDYSTNGIIEVIESQQPLYGFDPGTRWAYSNTAFELAGAVIETITGKPFHEFFRERLYPKAGMTDTAVDIRADIVPHRASGYTLASTPGGFENAIDLSWTIPGAAGCLRSTIGDLTRWHLALFGGQILNGKGLREMTSPSRLRDGRVASAGRSGPAAGSQPIQEYGLGLELSIVDGKKRVGHYGSIPGFGADIGTFPEMGLTVVALTNTDFGPDNPPRALDHLALESAAR